MGLGMLQVEKGGHYVKLKTHARNCVPVAFKHQLLRETRIRIDNYCHGGHMLQGKKGRNGSQVWPIKHIYRSDISYFYASPRTQLFIFSVTVKEQE